MSAAKYTGSCLCGGIRFSVSNEPEGVVYCHCEHCRKGAGGVGQVVATFGRDDVKIESGEDLISTYVFTQTTSGKPKDKTFCKACAAPLWTVTDDIRKTNQVYLRTALLHNGAELKPQAAIFTKQRPSWVKGSDGVADFETLP